MLLQELSDKCPIIMTGQYIVKVCTNIQEGEKLNPR